MSINQDSLKTVFKQFGLTDEVVSVYTFVLENNYVSPLEISRKLKIPRTQVYRCLNKLVEIKLIRQLAGENGAVRFCSDRPENILNLVHTKERDLLLLKSEISSLVNQLNQLAQSSSKDFEVLSVKIFYSYLQKLRNQEIKILFTNKAYEGLINYIHDSNKITLFTTSGAKFKKELNIIRIEEGVSDVDIMLLDGEIFLVNEYEVLRLKSKVIYKLLFDYLTNSKV